MTLAIDIASMPEEYDRDQLINLLLELAQAHNKLEQDFRQLKAIIEDQQGITA